jgi:hypothetical protein
MAKKKVENDLGKPPWYQLYLARRRPPPPEQTKPRGRPRRMIRRDIQKSFLLADGECREIDTWKERLSKLVGRQVSYGETGGILAQICSDRFTELGISDDKVSLEDLVNMMVRGK